MSSRTGLRALAQRRRTLLGVSSPESVVRSIQVMARNSQAACHSFLTVRRVTSVVALRSTALLLMRVPYTQSRSRGVPGLRSMCSTGESEGAVGASAAPLCVPLTPRVLPTVEVICPPLGRMAILRYAVPLLIAYYAAKRSACQAGRLAA